MVLISLWTAALWTTVASRSCCCGREVQPPETVSPHQPVLLHVVPGGFCFKDAKGTNIAAPWGDKTGTERLPPVA